MTLKSYYRASRTTIGRIADNRTSAKLCRWLRIDSQGKGKNAYQNVARWAAILGD